MATYQKGKETRLSNHFRSTEFDCKGKGCCRKTIIDALLIVYLQRIRNHFNKPVYINSGYRCAAHNKDVGGTTNSKHKYGMAADIRIDGVKPSTIAAYAKQIGVRGVGTYSTFIHIDTRRNKTYWEG